MGHVAVVIKIQYQKASAQGCQQFKSMRMAVRANVGARFHRDSQALHRVAQFRVEITMGTQAKGVCSLLALLL
ncbi:hypothetical protein D3C78_1006600 [compost metagenome]